VLLPTPSSDSYIYFFQLYIISYRTDFLTGHDGTYDLSGAPVTGLLAAAPQHMWAVRHYEPTAHNLFTFLPSTIFKLDFDNADRHVMSRTFRIMKKEGIWLRDPFDFGFNMKGVRKLFELGMLLRQDIKLCDCANYIPGSAVWVQHSTTTWPWQWKPLKNCCVITQSSGRSAWIKVENWKVIVMGRDGSRGCCRKMALHRRLSAVCARRPPARSAVYVQLVTDRQKGQGNSTDGCPLLASQHN